MHVGRPSKYPFKDTYKQSYSQTMCSPDLNIYPHLVFGQHILCLKLNLTLFFPFFLNFLNAYLLGLNLLHMLLRARGLSVLTKTEFCVSLSSDVINALT